MSLIAKGMHHFYFEDVNYINKEQWKKSYYLQRQKEYNYDRVLVNHFLQIANFYIKRNDLAAAKDYLKKVLALNNYHKEAILSYTNIVNLQCHNCNENCVYAVYLNEYVHLYLNDPIFK